MVPMVIDWESLVDSSLVDSSTSKVAKEPSPVAKEPSTVAKETSLVTKEASKVAKEATKVVLWAKRCNFYSYDGRKDVTFLEKLGEITSQT